MYGLFLQSVGVVEAALGFHQLNTKVRVCLLHFVGDRLAQFVIKSTTLAGGKDEGSFIRCEPLRCNEAHGRCAQQPEDNEPFANGWGFHVLLFTGLGPRRRRE